MKIIKKYKKHILIGLICGVFNGVFGAGGGSLAVVAMEKFLKIQEKKAHATAVAVILLMSSVSTFFYIKNGFFDFKVFLPVTIGGVLGGPLGAKLLSKISVGKLKAVFGAVIIITAVKMIF